MWLIPKETCLDLNLLWACSNLFLFLTLMSPNIAYLVIYCTERIEKTLV